MGSATREAVAAAKAAIAARPSAATLAVGEEIFSAARAVAGSGQLLVALTEPAADPAAKAALVSSVFGALSVDARELISGLARSRWSESSDFLAGLEEVGLRIMAASASGIDIPSELFEFGQLVSSNAELELAVGSKLGDPSAKAALVEKLLAGRVSEQTIAILSHLVRQPLGRRIGALVKHAADVVADESSLAIATVTVAAPLSSDQLDRLRSGLAKKYGDLRIDQVIDPTMIGGVRVAVGSDVIDDSVATRLKELKLQLAG
ncbi:F-type H+-transporting ATPase subunit delta [Cryobacterium mesophilum]|uniref:ATP synthase subunit delta n=1 Tax=Terrimesophilobacter mesophilus TaxID=433647 RepID=A0A4R8VDS7_9MICO|nr:F0F1 ATP synthase subunit delta [Terrimesophilobacter mesophilus]MBB5633976.1 F-type H+-transporting ATPase subunit delta [Terrimesophilobacter mesophilus]TFB80636.1 F0F1 ATP synthase subunit delta [Terrimesophilobacter mesophilus]